jgi:farnesyl-diphosphate farnesyltransferase
VSSISEHRLFIEDFIPRVSRTFALTIRFLPLSLRKSVHAAYLLCRVADTLEDSPLLESSEKSRRLTYLGDLLRGAEEGKSLSGNDFLPLYDSIDTNHGDDHRLLTESSKLFAVLESLPPDHRLVIYRRAAEMAGGMALYANPGAMGGDTIACLSDTNDWNRYCYYVAGTVGHMMTELFVDHFGIGRSTAEKLKPLGESFGLGLQKVNVIKDVPSDRERGVCFLPLDIMKKHNLKPSSFLEAKNRSAVAGFVGQLLELTVGHLDDAIEYTILMPRRHRGLRMFLTLPVFLAVETLGLVKLDPARAMSGPSVKLARSDVSRLVNAAAFRVMSNSLLAGYYQKLRKATS